MAPPNSPQLEATWLTRLRPTQEMVLALVLAVEIGVFALLGLDLTKPAAASQVIRLNVEIGLLALALTPVIITGGIDLSVGSLMGLSAVLFGKLWRDGGLPVGLAALATLGVGASAGGLNALLITRLRLPPLIVTLGTFSLFRGLAEGLTANGESFFGFPADFRFLGQGELFGAVPPQVVLYCAIALGYYLLLRWTTVGRTLYAIGLSPEGARYAGIPVARRLALVYVLSGAVASLAALLLTARLDQAKAEMGMGYELRAITAVVLGGTSIFGGRGTIVGTLLGFLLIAALQNGLPVTNLPSSLAGPLIGGLLLATISLERVAHWFAPSPRASDEEFAVKNAHVAILSAVILAAALIVAGSNWLLVRSLHQEQTRPADQNSASLKGNGPDKPGGKRITVAMMPKSLGNAYFKACQIGAEEAKKELGVELIWDGPTDPDSAAQSNLVEAWITRGVDVIAVAVEDKVALSSALKKARKAGIKVITWDSDAEPEARDFFVNQATPQGIGETLMDEAARVLGGKGDFAIITASLTSANMIDWEKQIEIRRAAKYPNIPRRVVLLPCQDNKDKAFEQANTILNAHKNVKLIMAICSPAVPGAAEAVKQAGRKDVKVIGLGLPKQNKEYVEAGITDAVILWNTMDLGYLTVHAAKALKEGTLKAGDHTFGGGRLGKIEIQGDNLLLGRPFVFTKENIGRFNF